MEAREAWFEGQLDLDPERVIFLDETATATNMERRYGRALRGERCRIAVPQGHYKTTTVTAVLRASGPFAVHLMDGATNGARLLSYVTDMLVPALTPGETVVMDNLAAHKVAGVRQAIEAAGAHLRYLPPLLPGLQPDRASLRQAESPAAHDGGPHRPGSVGGHPGRVHPLQTRRVPQLPRRCRLRCIRPSLNGTSSKRPQIAPAHENAILGPPFRIRVPIRVCRSTVNDQSSL